jgi:uncharacterized protein
VSSPSAAQSGAGPVYPTPGATRVHAPLPHRAVVLHADGWLGEWQRRNATATLPHVLDHVEYGEARGNLARLAGTGDQPFSGMFFTDSDVYKALEALAWAAGAGHLSGDLLARGDKLVDLLEKVQADDGYLNSYVQGTPGVARWSDPQWGHELYTAGHLFQAAVAASRAGVLTDLPVIAERMADLLVSVHGAADSPYLDGHPQVETALVELYRLTGESGYLELARHQLERRGHGWLGPDQFGSAYFQDHEPIRVAARATGHAVRQLYLLAGAVDVAVECHDRELLAAAERLWDDLFGTKTYISGGQGSRHRDEAIGDAYELPPDRAYAETCAAIASFQLNWRLLLATGRAKYADSMEIALYNVIAASTSVTGTAFFYSNPLQLRTGHDGSQEDVASRRLPWFRCACCPPNLARLLASVHDYLATTVATGLAVHHYSACTIDAEVEGRPMRLAIATNYPYDGMVRITVGAAATFDLALRIPAWCTSFTVTVDGNDVPAEMADGYVRLARNWGAGTAVELSLEMPARIVHPHPHIDAVRGSVAIMRGPLLFALEQADLASTVQVEDVRLVAVHAAASSPLPELSPVVVPVTLAVGRPASGIGLYADSPPDVAGSVPLEALLFPYHRWGNRTAGGMRVWIPTDAKTAP